MMSLSAMLAWLMLLLGLHGPPPCDGTANPTDDDSSCEAPARASKASKSHFTSDISNGI